jgi:hypothetical protein
MSSWISVPPQSFDPAQTPKDKYSFARFPLTILVDVGKYSILRFMEKAVSLNQERAPVVGFITVMATPRVTIVAKFMFLVVARLKMCRVTAKM